MRVPGNLVGLHLERHAISRWLADVRAIAEEGRLRGRAVHE
jgi:hypothetical protein